MHGKLLAVLATLVATPALAQGVVFTLSDDAAANAVLAYARAGDGSLRLAGTYPTGGQGSGGGEAVLGSQGALTLSRDGRFLLAVDAGSDEVAAFRVRGDRLVLAGRAPSGGQLPVSVTEHDGLVFVLNAGGAGNVSGLRLDEEGQLRSIPGATQPLGGVGVGPAQVGFDAGGEVVAVTEKAARAIALYRVGRGGRIGPPTMVPSAGITPFGFAFTRRDVLLVSEAAGGSPGGSSASSYTVDAGQLALVSGAVPDGQTAACWLAASGDGRHAFVSNAATGTVSSYAIDRAGALTLLEGAAGAIAGGKALDLALTAGDRFLYVLDPAHAAIQGFAVGAHGELVSLGAVAEGLPARAVGLAAR